MQFRDKHYTKEKKWILQDALLIGWLHENEIKS